VDQPARASVPAIDPAISTLAFRSIAVLVVVSAIVGRGLTVALRGWRVGLGDVIARADQTAATLAQLAVVAGGFLAVRLLVPTLRDRALGLWYRLGVAPVVPAVITTVFAAATGQLGLVMTLALGGATALIALAAAIASLSAPDTRGAGIVLGLCGAGALVELLAHALAVRAGEAALASMFAAARGLATFGFALDVGSVLLALLWLGAKSPRRLVLSAAGVLVLATAVAWFAHRGATTLDVGGRYDVLVARTLAELVRHPRPFVATVICYALEAAALILAIVCAFSRSRAALATSAVSLALAARMSTDIPLHALALTLGALLTPLAATRLVAPASRTDSPVSVETGAS
jgi:hypothetical protein